MVRYSRATHRAQAHQAAAAAAAEAEALRLEMAQCRAQLREKADLLAVAELQFEVRCLSDFRV